MVAVMTLQGDEAWQDFALPEGTLDDFVGMADGDLCGPRPHRGLYGAPMTTGQVLPSTHGGSEYNNYGNPVDPGPPDQQQQEGHVLLDIAPDADSGELMQFTNGQLQALMEGLDFGQVGHSELEAGH